MFILILFNKLSQFYLQEDHIISQRGEPRVHSHTLTPKTCKKRRVCPAIWIIILTIIDYLHASLHGIGKYTRKCINQLYQCINKTTRIHTSMPHETEILLLLLEILARVKCKKKFRLKRDKEIDSLNKWTELNFDAKYKIRSTRDIYHSITKWITLHNALNNWSLKSEYNVMTTRREWVQHDVKFSNTRRRSIFNTKTLTIFHSKEIVIRQGYWISTAKSITPINFAFVTFDFSW